MGSLRRFTCDDLLRFNNINLDVLTETVSEDMSNPWPGPRLMESLP
jgi:hypothetical protein